MPISLHQLPKRPGRRHRRVGRGHGSGRGTYSARGIKGQRARTGGRKGITRRALAQTMRGLPKQRGFKSITPRYVAVNLAAIERHFAGGDVVTPERLARLGYKSDGMRGLKILGSGKLTKALTVQAHAFSTSAAHAITQAGGRVIRLTTNGK